MATKNYHLHLKGFVGGYDFDADYIDYVMSKHQNEEVTVLIDSLGGIVSTALSISSAFARHGNVTVHFAGMNASAATIASLGAKRITMDASAMYLVHKCNTSFFEWGNMNADDLKALQQNIEKQRADLDKIDSNIAEMYARKCNKEAKQLLDLMKQGGWLTAKEALEWGFVDELTYYADEEAPELTDTMATAMAAAGIPVPVMPRKNIDVAQEDISAISRFFQSLAAMFKPNNSTARHIAIPTSETNQHNTPMNKICTHICKALSLEFLASENGSVRLSDAQLDAVEAAIAADRQAIDTLNAKVTALESEKQTLTNEKQALTDEKQTLENAKASLESERDTLTQEKATLQAQIDELKQKPADTSSTVVNSLHGEQHQQRELTMEEQYVETRNSARALFDLLP